MPHSKHGRFVKVPAYYMIPGGAGLWLSSGDLIFHSYRYNIAITIKAGSINNLASIPWFLRWLIDVNGPHRPAAALHDAAVDEGPNCIIYPINTSKPHLEDLPRGVADVLFLDAAACSRQNYYEALSPRARLLMENNGLSAFFLRDKTSLVPWGMRQVMYIGVRIGTMFITLKRKVVRMFGKK